MTITTKAVLANELGVTRGRISQYVRDGLPVRPDGKLNREEALNWLALNCRAPQHCEDRGANRARTLIGEMKRQGTRRQPSQRPEHGAADVDPAAHLIAAELVAYAGRIAGTVAVELGLATPIAAALDQAVTVHLWNEAERLLRLEECDRAFEELVDPLLQASSVDWLKVGADRGDALDEDALDAVIGSLDSLKPGIELPALPRAPPTTAEMAAACCGSVNNPAHNPRFAAVERGGR